MLNLTHPITSHGGSKVILVLQGCCFYHFILFTSVCVWCVVLMALTYGIFILDLHAYWTLVYVDGHNHTKIQSYFSVLLLLCVNGR